MRHDMKRGESGLSLIVGVNKPTQMTSHDVVNACRRIFNEKRVGHMGTLDPLATGVLPIAIGPATRLNAYLSDHDKSYRVTLVFGTETDTDDSEGHVVRTAPVSADLLDGSFAEAYVAGLEGEHMQVPPQYSAIKQGGVKAYEAARSGKMLNLQERKIIVHDAKLIDRFYDPDLDAICWTLDLQVSKGTYIRSIVRDLGRELGSLAYVVALERTRIGSLGLDQCMTLHGLEESGVHAALDPLRLLGIRFAFGDDYSHAIENGNKIKTDSLDLYTLGDESIVQSNACCTTTTNLSTQAPYPGELIGIVVKNRLKALYAFDASHDEYRSTCVFSQPIMRTYY